MPKTRLKLEVFEVAQSYLASKIRAKLIQGYLIRFRPLFAGFLGFLGAVVLDGLINKALL